MKTLIELWKVDQMERKSFDEYYQLNNRQRWNDAIENYKQFKKFRKTKMYLRTTQNRQRKYLKKLNTNYMY